MACWLDSDGWDEGTRLADSFCSAGCLFANHCDGWAFSPVCWRERQRDAFVASEMAVSADGDGGRMRGEAEGGNGDE